MNVAVLVFGNKNIGLGHLYRTYRFANWIRRIRPSWKITFFFKDSPETALFAKDHELEFNIFSEQQSSHIGNFDIVFFDLLNIKPDYLKTFKTHNKTLVSFDDFGPGHYEVHLAVNALYPCTLPRPKNNKTKVLSGFPYLIISPEFFGLRQRNFKSLKKVLVMQGGTNTHGSLEKILRELTLSHPDVELNALVGPAASLDKPFINELRSLISEQNIRWGIGNMAQFLSDYDLAILGAGMTSFESCAVGTPTILITNEPREKATAEQLQAFGIPYAGSVDEKGLALLNQLVLEFKRSPDLLNRTSALQQKIIDGQGVHRILHEIEALKAT